MEASRVDLFMMTNGKFFETHYLGWVREQLVMANDDIWPTLQTLQFKNPDTFIIVSLMGGQLGIDRFLLGDTGMGVGKLLTCGGLGIWTIIDWFTIMSAAREKNMALFQSALNQVRG
jgi:TM2 domain-containing membrane protein YozV